MYHENKYPAERNSKTNLNISPTSTEHIDIVSKPHIPFCSGNLKKKLNLRLYNGVAFNTLLPYTLTKHSSEWICMHA